MESMTEPPFTDPEQDITKPLRGNGDKSGDPGKKPGPKHLLDLPEDILRLVIRRVDILDLTSLALTSSVFYRLAIPPLYSRFDIVWPDEPSSPSIGREEGAEVNVDALSHGLSTLCMGSRFSQITKWIGGRGPGQTAQPRKLRDRPLAAYTRKFSIGNGPPLWTDEYMVTREGGKMLGTLVAMAVEKMVNLESFFWDMPTGVSSDVFMALASLQDHHDQDKCRLEEVSVRWHDSSGSSSSSRFHNLPVSAPHVLVFQQGTIALTGNDVSLDNSSSATHSMEFSKSRVEYPTFSVLPPLKSLTVLNIDDVAYLDEMAILIERSGSYMRVLRVGISEKARARNFCRVWDDADLQQVDHAARWPGGSRIGEKRLGGVLGVLVGRIYDIRKRAGPAVSDEAPITKPPVQTFEPSDSTQNSSAGTLKRGFDPQGAASPGNDTSPQAASLADGSSVQEAKVPPSACRGELESTPALEQQRLVGKLALQTLALERVPLSIKVCRRAIDWSMLTSLTILDCPNSEALWKTLRKQFQPTSPPRGSPEGTPLRYHLALEYLYTDNPTHHLVSFVKETLAPNTLAVLFLQLGRRQMPTAPFQDIFKGAVKRHHWSLRKLLLDGSLRNDSHPSRWRRWVLSSEMVAYIASGQMGNLRELAVALNYKDWHKFLQGLPRIQRIRSLHITNILNYPTSTLPSKELALQIVDIVSLRREIQLTYVAIGSKCFEVAEARCPRSSDVGRQQDLDGDDGSGGDNNGAEDDSSSDEEMQDDGWAVDTVSNLSDGTSSDSEDDDATGASDGGTSSEMDSVQQGDSLPTLRLWEISFYDERVAIFEARHGQL
ncbi:hypothetical protein GGR56DRAFT_622590 [Xylariaceae sp. FL0804]|nr:hypothetical protein GGR56DRAFT_622590 [Xylariaceae sp. FL0804]